MDKLYAAPIDDVQKRAIAATLKLSSMPVSQQIGAIVAMIPQERQAMIVKTAGEVRSVTNSVLKKGKSRLMDLSDSEWDQLVADANDEIN